MSQSLQNNQQIFYPSPRGNSQSKLSKLQEYYTQQSRKLKKEQINYQQLSTQQRVIRNMIKKLIRQGYSFRKQISRARSLITREQCAAISRIIPKQADRIIARSFLIILGVSQFSWDIFKDLIEDYNNLYTYLRSTNVDNFSDTQIKELYNISLQRQSLQGQFNLSLKPILDWMTLHKDLKNVKDKLYEQQITQHQLEKVIGSKRRRIDFKTSKLNNTYSQACQLQKVRDQDISENQQSTILGSSEFPSFRNDVYSEDYQISFREDLLLRIEGEKEVDCMCCRNKYFCF